MPSNACPGSLIRMSGGTSAKGILLLTSLLLLALAQRHLAGPRITACAGCSPLMALLLCYACARPGGRAIASHRRGGRAGGGDQPTLRIGSTHC